jgi:hypothetical protein
LLPPAPHRKSITRSTPGGTIQDVLRHGVAQARDCTRAGDTGTALAALSVRVTVLLQLAVALDVGVSVALDEPMLVVLDVADSVTAPALLRLAVAPREAIAVKLDCGGPLNA